MNVFKRNEAIDAMLEAHAAGLISNENLTLGGDMICELYDAQPAAELSKWDGSPRIVAAEPAPAEWTSYRDGRRVMHYLRADGGRYFVQKVEAGYAVTFLADEGVGVSVRLSTEATLAAGKKWVADHLAAAPTKERRPTLADVAAKFEDEPLYECEIPGAPGRITYGVPHAELPPGTYIGTIEAVTTNAQGGVVARVELLSGKVELRDHQKAAVADVVHGMQGRFITIPLHTGKIRACKRHRPKTYKPYTLGIDTFKVTYSARCNSLEDLRRLDSQDAKVCRIEQELVQYAGKRCTPHRDRKVAKLRKILRILKRGIYC